jgi:uncharacterized membrane protein
MEEVLKIVAAYSALAVELAAVSIVAFGAIQAFVRVLAPLVGRPVLPGWRKQVWVQFGMWLLLGLQFALAADILRSAISPSWTEIGQLAAIAAIRAFLNFFLEKDMEELGESGRRPDDGKAVRGEAHA